MKISGRTASSVLKKSQIKDVPSGRRRSRKKRHRLQRLEGRSVSRDVTKKIAGDDAREDCEPRTRSGTGGIFFMEIPGKAFRGGRLQSEEEQLLFRHDSEKWLSAELYVPPPGHLVAKKESLAKL